MRTLAFPIVFTTMYVKWVSGISMQGGLFAMATRLQGHTRCLPPCVHSHVFTAEFLGAHGNVSAANLDLGRPYLSTYAAYEDSKLSRVAIVSLELWDGHTHSVSERPSKAISLAVPSGEQKCHCEEAEKSGRGTALFTDRITWKGME